MMKKIVYLFLGLLVATIPSQAGERLFALSDNVAVAKENGRRLAQAITHDGFRVRESDWVVSLKPQEPHLLRVTLFAGNQYWFIAAASPPALVLQITLYDSTGKPIKGDRLKEEPAVSGARTAVGLTAPHSGNYFVKLELLKSQGKLPAETYLAYAYK
jgi:hypothetical protein